MPPPLELECLKALWSLGEATVRQVREVLAPGRPLAYTTVMTLLDRLARKGAVSRRKAGRSFLYTPVLAQDTLRRIAVSELIDCFFGGSPETLLAYLHGNPPGDPANPANPDTPPSSSSSLDPALL